MTEWVLDLQALVHGWRTEQNLVVRDPKLQEKTRAQGRVYQAVARGELARPSACERCGEPRRLDGHHTDYSRPLDVEWLCRACHRKEHHG